MNKLRALTCGIKNCRDSRLFKGCSPLQLLCNLTGNRPQSATFHTATVTANYKKHKTMETGLNLINYIVKATQHLIVVDSKNTEPHSIGSGCIVKYQNKVYLISVAHVADKNGYSTCIVTNQPQVDSKTPLYSVGSMTFLDEYNVINPNDLKNIKALDDIDLKKNETLDITFVELKESIQIFQKEIDFGGDYGIVTEGEKIMLNEPDLTIQPTI